MRRTLFVLAAVVIVTFVGLGCEDAGPPKKGGKPAARDGLKQTQQKQKKLPTRDELKARLIGKTRDETIEAIGRPDSTSEIGNWQVWYYRAGHSYDPIAQKPDVRLTVWFDNNDDGKARALDY